MSHLDRVVLDLVWSAGFWEGEGSCGVYKSNKTYKRLVCTAVQVDRLPIEKLKSLYGGAITETKRKDTKPIFCWTILNAKAELFLKTILPFVVSDYKRMQIEKALWEWAIYQTSLGKGKNISRRKKADGTFRYEGRVTLEGEQVFVGSFDDPEEAYLAMLCAYGRGYLEVVSQ